MSLKITFVTHACIRVDGAFGSLLTDPWILNEPIFNFSTWKFPAAVMAPESLTDVDFIYISHAHEDHFHVPSLHKFPRHLPILLPEYCWKPGLRAQTMERTLRDLGFYRVCKIKPWQTVKLGGGAALTVIPSSPTKPQDWENSGFVLEQPGFRLLNMNDCPGDPEIYREIDGRFGAFDAAFVQYAGVSMFPGCYRLSEEEMRAAVERRRHGFVQQRLLIDNLRVSRLFPFAGDFGWLHDRMFHCNWTNRSTPTLFTDFVREAYPARDLEVVVMHPSDVWTPERGLVRNHPEIDWSRYLEAIAAVKRKFQPKVERIEAWIEDYDHRDLEARSRAYTAHVERWISRDGIDFSGCFRLFVEGPNANFGFYLAADPEERFRIVWGEPPAAVDQTLYLREAVWAAVLEGKFMWNMVQWQGQNEQHVPFRPELGRFWFWLESHIDLNNRNPQALVERVQHPTIDVPVRPHLGVFPGADDWELPWLTEQRLRA